ncbi:MAG: prenyltransferase, partial [Desulfatiglandales bacterium]
MKKAYLLALRAPFLIGSWVPVLISGAYSFSEKGNFSWPHFFMTILGVSLLHLGANLINDYYDARGSDPVNLKVTPFSGGSRAIQDMGISPWMILGMSLFCFASSLAVGIWLVINERPLAILFGIIGLFLGWAYSSPPFSFMSRGLGELAIFLAFGPLLTMAGFYAISGRLDGVSFLLGIPQGCFITNVIWINQFPDIEADSKAAKRNLVIRLGPNLARYVYGLLLMAGILFPFILVGIGNISELVLL